ncbi:shikimate kinase [Desulfomicrobium apsheronum]|uniref:Shikimate kinase n=1 Tax=Desulfomicrobium apsheronum TaxID=52560 RepID=A0A1I3W7R0_9BACT|nr:shikimate kinase AroL [Desulfomicrobium apsheronum]SFK03450.1 shikimate kinase [Desulfomicrobium apsheronum]
MTNFIKKKVEIEDDAASMTFRPGQFKREPFSLQKKNIFLLGMRASGKTTVGTALAEVLKCPCVDTDAMVVAEAGQSINAIVAERGWDAFRALEEAALVKAAALPGKVVSTGGGIVLSQANRDLMYRSGVSFYLAADAGLLIARMLRDPNVAQRPALTPLALHDEVAAVMSEREALYMAGMDHMLQAHRSVEELVDDVLVALGLKEWDYSEKERVLDRY